MKKRKSLIVLTITAALALVAAVALYFVGYYSSLHAGIDLMAYPQYLINAVTKFDNLLLTVPVIAVAAVWLILSLIWIIVDIKRKKGVVALYVILFLVSALLTAAFAAYALPQLSNFANFKMFDWIVTGVASFSYLLFITLFIVDLATYKKPLVVSIPLEEKKEEIVLVDESKEEEDEEKIEEVYEEEVEEESLTEEEEKQEESSEDVEDMKDEPKEKKASKPAKKAIKKAAPKKEEADDKPAKKEAKSTRSTQSIILTNSEGQNYAKAYHVSRRAELNKWQVKATGSSKPLKLFNTQKEAIEYAEALSKSTGASVRVHSKTGKIRKHK